MIELADTAAATHPRLDALVERARRRARSACPRIGLVHPCDCLLYTSDAADEENLV